ncbi:hypothetical protein [Planctomonas deserti]|nr:hypothetical protein [Planctomonas deserti]
MLASLDKLSDRVRNDHDLGGRTIRNRSLLAKLSGTTSADKRHHSGP